MQEMKLDVYYDNPNEASDMYLKYLKRDCESAGIDVRVFNNIRDWATVEDPANAELFLEPTSNMVDRYDKETPANVDNPSATAEGIYRHIVEKCPNRETIIAVIGRGLVGKQLINQLIDYGYTVLEFNSKSNFSTMTQMCFVSANVVIGLATENIFSHVTSECMADANIWLIDGANNFDTDRKDRCGKWTREVIIERVLNKYREKEDEE
jgi:5,10-methylene-tetrahydrofolate dehydrogenase/methenyl tetrahydrofolate cyclohydrolase